MDPASAIVDAEEREHLIAALAELVAARGWEQFALAPLLFPAPDFFPDPWTQDAVGVWRLSKRLLRYAGLGELDVDVRLFAENDPATHDNAVHSEHHPGTAAWFAGIEDGVCFFGANISQLPDALGITASLAHESAHAFRFHHGLMVDDVFTEEQLTDLTTVYLGFGVLNANATARHRSWNTNERPWISARSFASLGYLSPQAMCFLLACQSAARGARDRTIERALEANQADYYRKAFAWIEREAPDLLARLGIPPRDGWPSPHPLAPFLASIGDPPDADEPDEPGEADEPAFVPAAVSRVPYSRAVPVAAIGSLLGIAPAIALFASGQPWLGAVAWIGAFGGAVWLGRRYPEWRCSNCNELVRRSDSQCRGCQGRFVRDLTHERDRLDDHEPVPAPAVPHSPYRDDEDGLPFAAEDIDGSGVPAERGVLRPSIEGTPLDSFAVARLERQLDVVLPFAYAEYLRKLGPGTDSDLVELWSPQQITAERAASLEVFRAGPWRLELEDRDRLDLDRLVAVGITCDGDRLALHPELPKHLLWLRIEERELVDMGTDFDAAMDEICDLPADRRRWFAASSLETRASLRLPAAKELSELLARILEFGQVCLLREHDENDNDEAWLLLVPGIGGTVRLQRAAGARWSIEVATDAANLDTANRLVAALSR